MRTFSKIDPREVARLYCEAGASIRSVASKLGVHPSTVRDAVLATGAVLKPVGDVEGKGWKNRHERRRIERSRIQRPRSKGGRAEC